MEITYEMVPMDDRLIVVPDEQADKSSGEYGKAIDLSAKRKEPPVRGTVLAVGPGKLLDDGSHVPMGIQKHEKVFFSRYAGEEVETEGPKVVIMHRHELLCVLRPVEKKEEKVETES